MSLSARRKQRVAVALSGGSGVWLSGASGSQAANGTFGTWRGTPIGIGGVWMDTNETAHLMGPQWSLGPGNLWGSYNGPIDIAPGGIWLSAGESWASAAAGAYDGRWTTFWQRLAQYWAPRDPSLLYVRLAHEYNITSSPWRVVPGQEANFVTAWRRWHAIKQSILPSANLSWCPNCGSSYHASYDIRSTYPGDAYVDVVSTDWYNNWPWVNTEAAFLTKINQTETGGAPVGIERWRQFAQSRGKPMAISEWASAANPSGVGGGGDAPVFMEQLHAWLSQYGGTGAGQVLYEVLFNISGYNDSYMLYPTTDQPLAAERYRQLF